MSTKLEKKLANLPKEPGVYQYKDAQGQIIYVGKAAILKNRVRQYFQKSRPLDTKTSLLVAEIADMEWITVDSEIDALFLEAELVRRYLPKYNILLRDDKSTAYVRINYKDIHPTVTTTRRPLDDGAEYFGPYFAVGNVRKALYYLRKAFPFSTHAQNIPKRACLQYQLGLCPGLEGSKTTLQEYRANLRKLMQYLRGERKMLVKQIEREMNQAAKLRDFELASKLRNQLFALKGLSKQIIFSDREFMDLSKDEGLHELAELLGLYTTPAQETHLDGMHGSQPKRTNRTGGTVSKASVQLTKQSAESLAGATSSTSGQGKTVRLLRRIEGFDISHMSGTDSVASMVVFTNGIPNKAEYRKFKMRLPGNNDFAHMNETINRRLSEKNRKAWGLPSLFLIDGGKGQLSAALDARDAAGCSHVPMVGLAKREEEIVVHNTRSIPGATTQLDQEFTLHLLPKNSHAVKLLQRIRDESHRFAVSYHTVLKRARQKSNLEEIPGIGPATRKKLLKTFGSVRGISQVPLAELAEVIGAQKAEVVHKYLAAYEKNT